MRLNLRLTSDDLAFLALLGEQTAPLPSRSIDIEAHRAEVRSRCRRHRFAVHMTPLQNRASGWVITHAGRRALSEHLAAQRIAADVATTPAMDDLDGAAQASTLVFDAPGDSR